jgi:predicted nucleic acid-binding protein
MTLVVDASVAFKWFAQEEGTDRAVRLLERGEPIVAPDLILAEVCNAAWKSLRRRELSALQFEGIVNDVARPFARLVLLDQLIRPAAALTHRLDHPIYDCLYLALADAEGIPVITADQRLLAVVRGTDLAGRVSLL